MRWLEFLGRGFDGRNQASGQWDRYSGTAEITNAPQRYLAVAPCRRPCSKHTWMLVLMSRSTWLGRGEIESSSQVVGWALKREPYPLRPSKPLSGCGLNGSGVSTAEPTPKQARLRVSTQHRQVPLPSRPEQSSPGAHYSNNHDTIPSSTSIHSISLNDGIHRTSQEPEANPFQQTSYPRGTCSKVRKRPASGLRNQPFLFVKTFGVDDDGG